MKNSFGQKRPQVSQKVFKHFLHACSFLQVWETPLGNLHMQHTTTDGELGDLADLTRPEEEEKENGGEGGEEKNIGFNLNQSF